MREISNIVTFYSKSLYKQAVIANIIDIIKRDFDILNQIYKFSKIRKVILQPIISAHKKMDFFNYVSNIYQFNQLTKNFLKVLVKNNRIFLLIDIISDFRNQIHSDQNKISGDLVSASKLTKTMVNNIRFILEEIFKKKIALHNIIDKSIMGGIIFKYGYYEYDISLLGAIEKLKFHINQYY